MKITEVVAEYILELLKEQDGYAEIQRNELASVIGCVPSQINYVITSRFTPEHGFIVESRRGSGGYIRIYKVEAEKEDAIMHLINSIGATLDKASGDIIIENMEEESIINKKTANILRAVNSERSYINVQQDYKDLLRADMFKNILLTLV